MKRLILCCDGTWHDADRERPSNVLHLARAIRPVDVNGTQQITAYLPGLGTESPLRLGAALTGHGIDSDIQQAYRFLVHNYSAGDEIWCFGYSRGAYTVRSLIGLVRNAWLLHKAEAARVAAAYHIYRTLWGPDADNAQRFRKRWCREVGIHFLGVWDTVGALGIPLPVIRKLSEGRYAFHDTRLSRIVRHALHAVAIDERRSAFAPTIWRTRHGRIQSEQSWFSGSHGDVGGGLREAGLAAISLRWMADEASGCGLDLDDDYLDSVYATAGEETVHRSDRGVWRALGREWREIGVTNADETLHISAEQRFLRHAEYRPQNLKSYIAANDQLQLPL